MTIAGGLLVWGSCSSCDHELCLLIKKKRACTADHQSRYKISTAVGLGYRIESLGNIVQNDAIISYRNNSRDSITMTINDTK